MFCGRIQKSDAMQAWYSHNTGRGMRAAQGAFSRDQARPMVEVVRKRETVEPSVCVYSRSATERSCWRGLVLVIEQSEASRGSSELLL